MLEVEEDAGPELAGPGRPREDLLQERPPVRFEIPHWSAMSAPLLYLSDIEVFERLTDFENAPRGLSSTTEPGEGLVVGGEIPHWAAVEGRDALDLGQELAPAALVQPA